MIFIADIISELIVKTINSDISYRLISDSNSVFHRYFKVFPNKFVNLFSGTILALKGI